jgi:hypothetical protein
MGRSERKGLMTRCKRQGPRQCPPASYRGRGHGPEQGSSRRRFELFHGFQLVSSLVFISSAPALHIVDLLFSTISLFFPPFSFAMISLLLEALDACHPLLQLPSLQPSRRTWTVLVLVHEDESCHRCNRSVVWIGTEPKKRSIAGFCRTNQLLLKTSVQSTKRFHTRRSLHSMAILR